MKYRNTWTKYDGRSFQSKFEASTYRFLKDLENLGEISDLECQVTVYLTDAKIMYKPDFKYRADGQPVWGEAKGLETATWRIKRRLWMHYGPGKLEIYKQKKGCPFLYEVITPRKTPD